MRRRLLNDICQIEFVDKIDTIAGDVCIVDNNTLDKYFITSDSIECLNYDLYTPIGVVVVPASHTDDGTARVISLASMDYNNPDNGNANEDIYIEWGGYGDDVPDLDNKVMYPCIAEDLRSISGEQQITGWYNFEYFGSISECLPSDYYNNYPNPYDEGTYYYTGTTTSTYKAMPSPYLTGGVKNEIYHDTSNTGNVLADMNGKSNTSAILAVDNGLDTSWQTASTITSITSTGYQYHPTAQCCWRYHTIGTNQGDWYLPSGGELGYLASRWKAINNSINKLVSSGLEALVFPVGHGWWSSTEYSNLYVIDFSFGSYITTLGATNKSSRDYVRAFLAV